jgi:hypothetical protein
MEDRLAVKESPRACWEDTPPVLSLVQQTTISNAHRFGGWFNALILIFQQEGVWSIICIMHSLPRYHKYFKATIYSDHELEEATVIERERILFGEFPCKKPWRLLTPDRHKSCTHWPKSSIILHAFFVSTIFPCSQNAEIYLIIYTRGQIRSILHKRSVHERKWHFDT